MEWAGQAWGGVSYITISISDRDASVIYTDACIVLSICGVVCFHVEGDAPRRLYKQMGPTYFSVRLSNRYIYHCPHTCRGTLTPSELLNKTFVPFRFQVLFFFTHLKGTWETTVAHLSQSNLNQRWWESGYSEGGTGSREVAFHWWMKKGHQQDVCADLVPADALVDACADASYDWWLNVITGEAEQRQGHYLIVCGFFFFFQSCLAGFKTHTCTNTPPWFKFFQHVSPSAVSGSATVKT